MQKIWAVNNSYRILNRSYYLLIYFHGKAQAFMTLPHKPSATE